MTPISEAPFSEAKQHCRVQSVLPVCSLTKQVKEELLKAAPNHVVIKPLDGSPSLSLSASAVC